MRHQRLRKWAKWVCTVTAVVVLGLSICSAFWGVGYLRVSPRRDHAAGFDLYGGLFSCFNVSARGGDTIGGHSGWELYRLGKWRWGLQKEMAAAGEAEWHMGVNLWNPQGSWEFGVSVLYPILLFSLPAALLWYSDRRRFGPHQCAGCGYDRRGLAAESKCPECAASPAPLD